MAKRAMVAAGGKVALFLVMTVAKANRSVTLAVFRAAPGAATIFLKHPHKEGRDPVVFEVEGAPPAQAAHAGKRQPAAG